MAGRGTGATRATRELTRLGIVHTVHAYDHGVAYHGVVNQGAGNHGVANHGVANHGAGSRRADGGSYGAEAAAALGVPAGRVFKTLIASVDGALVVAVVPVNGQLGLKALADALGGKRAEMAQAAAAERATGYVTGGISPIAQRRRLPVVIDRTALDWPTVFCSAGQRGLQVELAPSDLVRATGARLAAIARPAAS